MRSAVAAAGDNPRDRLVALVVEVAEWVSQPCFRGCAFRNYLAEFPGAGGTAGADAPLGSPALVARTVLASSRRAVADLVGRLDVDDPERLVEQLWLVVDGLFMQAAYRDRLDDRVRAASDAAVVLATRLVGGSSCPSAPAEKAR